MWTFVFISFISLFWETKLHRPIMLTIQNYIVTLSESWSRPVTTALRLPNALHWTNQRHFVTHFDEALLSPNSGYNWFHERRSPTTNVKCVQATFHATERQHLPRTRPLVSTKSESLWFRPSVLVSWTMGERLPRRETYKAAQTHSLNLNRRTVGKARANFTSKDDKLEAGQPREGVLSSEKSELPKGRKSALFIGKLPRDIPLTNYVIFLFLVIFLHDPEVTSFL